MVKTNQTSRKWANLDLTSQLEFSQLRLLAGQSQWWPKDELAAYQSQCLKNLLTHASYTVPFYKERLQAALSEYSVNSSHLLQLKKIPLLTRNDIQEHLPDLTSNSIPESHLPTNLKSTSGSTGQPTSIINTRLLKMSVAAGKMRWNRWRGMENGDKVANLRQHNTSDQIKTWGEADRDGAMVSFNVKNPIKSQIAWLQAEQPDHIVTYPSNLDAMLQYSVGNSISLPPLKGISTLGEVLRDTVRERCQEVLGIRLMDSYGATEFGYLANKCPEYDHYHVQADNVIIEVLNEEGNDCQPGENGRLVITSLRNYASPLIRYDMNDFAEIGTPCPCGRGLPVIKKILGRSRNMFIYPSGDRFWPAFSKNSGELVRKVPAISHIQLVQDKLDEITIRLVVKSALLPEDEVVVKKTYRAALGSQFKLGIEYVDAMPKSTLGKFQDTICNVKLDRP